MFMATVNLIAESGATKAEWCLVGNGKKKSVITQGISPYFFNEEKVIDLLQNELLPPMPGSVRAENIYYYGTGMRNPENVKMLKRSLQKIFTKAKIEVNDDMLAAARGVNGKSKGLA